MLPWRLLQACVLRPSPACVPGSLRTVPTTFYVNNVPHPPSDTRSWLGASPSPCRVPVHRCTTPPHTPGIRPPSSDARSCHAMSAICTLPSKPHLLVRQRVRSLYGVGRARSVRSALPLSSPMCVRAGSVWVRVCAVAGKGAGRVVQSPARIVHVFSCGGGRRGRRDVRHEEEIRCVLFIIIPPLPSGRDIRSVRGGEGYKVTHHQFISSWCQCR
ncbi:hypothetical protein B0H19DRAFT_444247 [Mycena capillaripes]|nr:hypothetical protein B0H19DRAFT_444247 [Mycena capillaripes]